MNHELAQELKDAGFPQTWYLGARYYSDVSHPRMGRYPGDAIGVQVSSQNDMSLGVRIPTLEELIEACGKEGFGRLVNDDFGRHFYATDFADNYKGSGLTSTEAVARLWLALNKKA